MSAPIALSFGGTPSALLSTATASSSNTAAPALKRAPAPASLYPFVGSTASLPADSNDSSFQDLLPTRRTSSSSMALATPLCSTATPCVSPPTPSSRISYCPSASTSKAWPTAPSHLAGTDPPCTTTSPASMITVPCNTAAAALCTSAPTVTSRTTPPSSFPCSKPTA